MHLNVIIKIYKVGVGQVCFFVIKSHIINSYKNPNFWHIRESLFQAWTNSSLRSRKSCEIWGQYAAHTQIINFAKSYSKVLSFSPLLRGEESKSYEPGELLDVPLLLVMYMMDLDYPVGLRCPFLQLSAVFDPKAEKVKKKEIWLRYDSIIFAYRKLYFHFSSICRSFLRYLWMKWW